MMSAGTAGPKADKSYSGRRFIIALVIAVLAFWATIGLAFNLWRQAYLKKAEVGRKIAHQVRVLVDYKPVSISRPDWEDAVDYFEAMLIAVTGSNLLGQKQLEQVDSELQQLISNSARDHEKSFDLVRTFWNELNRRTGPTTEIYGRPDCFKK